LHPADKFNGASTVEKIKHEYVQKERNNSDNEKVDFSEASCSSSDSENNEFDCDSASEEEIKYVSRESDIFKKRFKRYSKCDSEELIQWGVFILDTLNENLVAYIIKFVSNITNFSAL